MSADGAASLKEEIRRAALAAGFDAARFAAPDYGAKSSADLAAFLAAGRAGTMGWLEREPEKRGDPKARVVSRYQTYAECRRRWSF